LANEYLVASGFVQKFGDKDAVTTREANGKTVRNVTIKAVGSQKLIQVTFWPELAGVELGEGYFVAVEGKYSTSGDQNQFHNISAYRAVSIPSGPRLEEHEVVNQGGDSQAAAASSDDGPPPF
jgi:hypothetical protein